MDSENIMKKKIANFWLAILNIFWTGLARKVNFQVINDEGVSISIPKNIFVAVLSHKVLISIFIKR